MAKAATLKLETLHLIPGLSEDFDQQVGQLVDDCRKRPAIPQPREISVVLRITPHPRDADDVLISPITKTKAPARRIDPVRGRCTPKNQLQFDFAPEQGEEDQSG